MVKNIACTNMLKYEVPNRGYQGYSHLNGNCVGFVVYLLADFKMYTFNRVQRVFSETTRNFFSHL